MTRRLRRGSRACSPMGRSIASSGDPKGVQGGERKAPLLAATGNNFAVRNSPGRGLTRRLRRELGLAVPRGAHTFLSVAKEKCAKESQRHGDSGKKPFIAHFGGGARYVARSGVGQLRLLSCALGARLFPPSKWAGLFPSAAYRRSAPPQSAWGRLTPCGWDASVWLGEFCSLDEWTDFLCPVGGGQAYPLRVEVLQCSSYFFAAQKASGISNPRWPLLRAMRPVAKWRSMLYNRQGAAPDRRAARPIAERR